ncbi:hypothetical protein PIB30_010179 [Stylosanthes scabra]|uniref:Uncharacterized protein n=1 Tax=Stylosanthes scabra TaxID=79078 RepID=A0ABU6R6V5_9FABA|nr:hypothetical protein [Stylosanthes scabra]
MAALLKKRKGKALVQSSSEVPRFKTPYHEAHYNAKLSARKVLPKLIIQVDESIIPLVLFKSNKESGRSSPIRFKLLATTCSRNSMPMLGNQIKKKGSHTLTQQWIANKDYRLDHVQEDLCIEGGEWVRHKDGRPHYLRRADLEPMTKGWYDFVCRSILPTTNRSELTVERVVLIKSTSSSTKRICHLASLFQVSSQLSVRMQKYPLSGMAT